MNPYRQGVVEVGVNGAAYIPYMERLGMQNDAHAVGLSGGRLSL